MEPLKVAESHLRQAGIRLAAAVNALKLSNFPFAVRLSQECVELSLKAALRLVGIEYSKIHDVSTVLLAVRERFSPHFRREVDDLAESSRILAAKREVSFYGVEESGLTPDEALGREDAVDAVARARRAHAACKRLYERLTRRASKS